MSVPVGYGLPGWLDTDEYLSADETRGLGSIIYTVGERHPWGLGTCAICGEWRSLQKAHIVRVGSSGRRRRGTDGPKVGLCFPCHTDVDTHQASKALAVRRRDKAVCLVEKDGPCRVLMEGER